MDIHKPKPWHGVREFLKEYVIIVVGVLTALAFEAVVQNLHEARLSAEARAAVRGEINGNLTNMKRRAAIEPCIARRLAELSGFVARAEAGEAIQPPLTIGAPGHPATYTERWDAATAGGRTSLLSLDEQTSYALIYEEIRTYQTSKLVEREVWGELVGLEGVRRPSPELLAQARRAIGRARLLDYNIQRTFYEMGFAARRIRITGDARLTANGRLKLAQPYLTQAICMPLSTPLDDAAKAANDGIPLSP